MPPPRGKSTQTRRPVTQSGLHPTPEKTATPRESESESSSVVDGVHIISPTGDLVLDVRHNSTEPMLFRVKRTVLQTSSGYFRAILSEDGFLEGRTVNSQLSEFQTVPAESIHSSALPRIEIEDLGDISVKSPHTLLTDFFRILHGHGTLSPQMTVTSLAYLTVVADRFDAIGSIKTFARAKRLFQSIDARPSATGKAAGTLGIVYQKAYLAIHLDHGLWLTTATQNIIQRIDPEPPATMSEYFHLPTSLEKELIFRRRALLSTIPSLLQYLLGQYTSGPQQCKLGYDSSPACDSFQLGEMTKFLLKTRTFALFSPLLSHAQDVDLSPPFLPSDTKLGYDGSLLDLLDRLRQVPNYQVDANHHHCGLRSRLLPCLDLLQRAVEECGICHACWTKYREEYAWSQVRRPLIWRRGEVPGRQDRFAGTASRMEQEERRCLERHRAVRDMCLANEQVWEIPAGEGRGFRLENGLVGMKLQPGQGGIVR